MDYFSRTFDRAYYEKAMLIYNELLKNGTNPKVRVNTWELYDSAFSFPRVRRYELVQTQMDLLEHFQDNLNQNFTNSLAVDNFIRVAKEARRLLNEKYHDGEFADPANTDPGAEPADPSWATAKL